MKNLLAQLESNEAVLLLYLAGELPEQDKAEVEHLLQRDSGMRDQLEHLQSTMAFVEQEFISADASVSAASTDAVIRSTLRAMRQWRATGISRTPITPEPQTSLPMPWWCYPLAAAASILLALAAWVASIEPEMGSRTLAGASRSTYPIQPADWIDNSASSLPAEREAYATVHAGEITAAFEDTDRLLFEFTNDPLSVAQQEMQQLQEISSEVWN